MSSATPIEKFARAVVSGFDVDGLLASGRAPLAPDSIAALKKEVDRLSSVDLVRAGLLADATHRAAMSLGDEVSLGFGEAALARVHHVSGRTGEAATCYRSAIDRLRGARRRADAAALEMQLVAVLMRLGQSAEGFVVARRARPVLRRTGDVSLIAQLDANIGSLHYFGLESYTTALNYLDRARSVFASLDDSVSLAFVEFNRGNVLVGLDRPHEALELFAFAHRVLVEEKMARAAAQVEFTWAQTLAQLGRYGEALRRFHAARDRFEGLGDRLNAAWSSLALAELNLTLNDVAGAADLASSAITELAALGYEAEVARAHLVLGECYSRKRQNKRAAAEVEKARAVLDRLGLSILGAAARIAEASLALRLGEPTRALQLASEGARVYGRAKLPNKRGRARLAEAEAARALGMTGHALRLARMGLAEAARAEDPWLSWRSEFLIGELELSRGRRESAIVALESAVGGIERLRSRLGRGEARVSFLEDKLAPYERLVQLNLEEANPRGLRAAFRYVQMAKSRALAELMDRSLTAPSGGDEPTGRSRLRDEMVRRLEKLSWYSSRLDRPEARDGRRERRYDRQLQGELRRTEQELEALFRRLEAEDEIPDARGVEPAGLDEVAAELDGDETLVEYFGVGDRICAFVMARNHEPRQVWLGERSHVAKLLQGLRFQLSKFSLDDRYSGAHRSEMRQSADRHLRALYEALIAPLDGLLDGRRVVFAPHGTLHYVPMHALRGPDGRYLIEGNEVSYAPSATLLRACRRNRRSAELEAMLAVGVPDKRTPFIRDELAALSRLFPDATLLEGESARKAAFLDRARRSGLVHIATHGSFRRDNPMFSSVRLADAPLSFYDLFNVSLRAELVTLSACNTGVNDSAPGDELCGLMRGFLLAGVPSLLVSLWAVHDRSTCGIMESFYRELSSGADKRAALRTAELEALEQYGHPYYWAPFVLIGNHRSLSQRTVGG